MADNIQFDLEGARRAGYNDDQIADAIGAKAGFDSNGARQAGHKSVDIINRLSGPQQQAQQQQPVVGASPQVTMDKPGVGETLLIGAGRTFDRVGKGMQQMWHGMRGNDAESAALKAEADSDNEQYAKLQKMRPIATAIGESLPSMAIPVGAPATALGMVGRLAATSAIPAALEYGTAEERAKNAAGAGIGAVVGGVVVPKLAGAAVQGGKNALRSMAGNITPEAVQLAAKAEAAGIKVNAAQLGDSKFLKTLASALEQMPFTGAAKQTSDQRGAFTRAISKTFGEDSDKITPEVYKAAKTRLGKSFDDLSARNVLDVTPELGTKLQGIMARAEATGSDETIRAVKNIIGRATEQAQTTGGKVPAQMSSLVDD
jgi:DNA-directed RNA polymerase subunit F